MNKEGENILMNMSTSKIKKINKIIIILFIIAMIFSQVSLALDTTTYSNIYNKPDGSETLFDKGGKILGVVQAVGTSISIISLLIIGIIYITSSPEKKSELKERLILFTVGAIIFFAASNIVAIVANFGKGFNE